MAIIVEDGSGKKGAQTYGTVAAFEAYMTARSIDITSLSTPVKEACLVKATDYIDTRWGLKFKGNRQYSSLMPRSVFTLSDQPSDGETVTIGLAVATFRTTATLDTEAEIGDTLTKTLQNLATALAAADADQVAADQIGISFLITDLDNPTLTCYVVRDGVATTETSTNGSFDQVTSSGYSGLPQVLEFPRFWLYDRAGVRVYGIPVRLQEAMFEYAYRANTNPLAPDPTVDASGLRLTGTEKKVGPIVTKYTYAENQVIKITQPYPAADRLLQEYVSTGGIIRA